MSSPWIPTALQRIRACILFVLWSCLAVNCGIAAIYSIFFTFRTFQFAWDWACRNWYSLPW